MSCGLDNLIWLKYLPAKSSTTQDVPKGSVTKHTWNDSSIYPGTTRDYWDRRASDESANTNN